ncbi:MULTISPECIES: DegV family protein [Bacillaceae]|uniref:Fatty acid-binding protein DegV n=1 Tax=Gottfriedia luciferensis TaxID=178774 RepID=A0ABX2ZZ20_9BACI|nr:MULTISPECIES: DegV family protein [Bacillaceae]ODG93880.1 fatty acid-binding protein DegV [Gottfriedia luciferensis]SFC31142.1 EDD domain protein, DegV family [Bacillus sp. UNCCL81]
MNLKIITDSAADLPKEIIEQYNIDVIPLRVYSEDEKEYFDGLTLDSKTLFNEMRNGKVFKTSLPSYEYIYNTFAKYAKENTPCIYIAFSSELSGTYQSAVMVKNEFDEELPDFNLEIFDTKSASIGQGLIAVNAAKLAMNGATKEEVINNIKHSIGHIEHIFTVDDLQYLVRGGRLSKVAGFVGNLLNIKPILHVEDGKLIPLEKIRGSKKLIKRILEIMESRGTNLSTQLIGISHGDDLDKAIEIKNAMAETFGCKEFVINSIGSAIGAHAGPGTLAIFFMNENKK